jgi:hypothetical protein
MALTTIQLKSLRYDLKELAHIEYDDVLNELLDHYATLTEQKMANGLSFQDASKWAWAELGSGPGLQAVENDYVKNIQRQLQNQHYNVMKSYFRWPTIVTTLLLGLLVYMVVPMIPVRMLILGSFCIMVLPLLVLLKGYWNGYHRTAASMKIVWKFIEQKGVWPVNLFQMALNGSNAIMEDGRDVTQAFLQAHMSVSVVVCLLVLLYSISLIQLYRQVYTYKLA